MNAIEERLPKPVLWLWVAFYTAFWLAIGAYLASIVLPVLKQFI